MHDVTLVYTEYNHRLEVWVLGKRAANTTADRQQYTNTSKVCDDTMSMHHTVKYHEFVSWNISGIRSMTFVPLWMVLTSTFNRVN